jgi:hypothetical protein
MRKLGCSSAVDTPPCSLERTVAEEQPAADLGTLEAQGSETERLKKAIRQLGCLVEAAVADAAHRNQATFIEHVHKHEADAELVRRLYNAMRTTKPHMYRRLCGIVQTASARPAPKKTPAQIFDVHTWCSETGFSESDQLSKRVSVVRNCAGAHSILKHRFTDQESLLRELRCLYLTTGMPGIAQAQRTPAGDLGVLYWRGAPAAILTIPVPGNPLSQELLTDSWIVRCQPCAASVAKAVAHLHAAHLLHGDIHPGNVIVARGGTCVTLCDLGHAAFADEGLQKYGRRGWKAPECRHATGDNAWELPFVVGEKAKALDVWALSVTLLCMATSRASFAPAGDEQDEKMRRLALDIGRDLDLWGRRHRLTQSPCLDRTSSVWVAAAQGLQISPRVRLQSRRIVQLLENVE